MFALFVWEPYEANGGLNDLKFVGTLADCIDQAEAIKRDESVQIADMESMTIVMAGEGRYFPLHKETGLSSDIGKGEYRLVWFGA